jgi:hypothetical protein
MFKTEFLQGKSQPTFHLQFIFSPPNRAVYEIMHCCFSTATMVTRTSHNVTLHLHVLSRIALPFTSRSSKWSPFTGFPPTKVCVLLRTLPHAQIPPSVLFLNSRSLCSSFRARDKDLLAPKSTRKTVCVFLRLTLYLEYVSCIHLIQEVSEDFHINF